MKEDKDITLPYELALNKLTLNEIGTIFKSFAFVKMSHKEFENSMQEDMSEYHETINDLINREILSVEYNDRNEATMHINLEKKKEPFWDVHEYDDYGNPDYYHYSGYGDEDGPWNYMVRPLLVNMQIEWQDCSDIELALGYMEPFKSLEKAEGYYQELIDETSKYTDDVKIEAVFWVCDEESSFNENNQSYNHTFDYAEGDYYIVYLRSIESTNGTMWKLSRCGSESGPEIFNSKEEAQEYCEKLFQSKNLKNYVSR